MIIQNFLRLHALESVDENFEFKLKSILQLPHHHRSSAYSQFIYYLERNSLCVLEYQPNYNLSRYINFSIPRDSKNFSIRNVQFIRLGDEFYLLMASVNEIFIYDVKKQQFWTKLEISTRSDPIIFSSKCLQFNFNESYIGFSTQSNRIILVSFKKVQNNTLNIQKYELVGNYSLMNSINSIMPNWLKSKKKDNSNNTLRLFLFKQQDARSYISVLIVKNSQIDLFTLKFEQNNLLINKKWSKNIKYNDLQIVSIQDVKAQLIQNEKYSRFYIQYIFYQKHDKYKTGFTQLVFDSIEGTQILHNNGLNFENTILERFELQSDHQNIYIILKNQDQNQTSLYTYDKINRISQKPATLQTISDFVVITDTLIITKDYIYQKYLDTQNDHQMQKIQYEKEYLYFEVETNKILKNNRNISQAISLYRLYTESVKKFDTLIVSLQEKIRQLEKWIRVLKTKQFNKELINQTLKQIIILRVQIYIINNLMNQKFKEILIKIQSEQNGSNSCFLQFFLSASQEKLKLFLEYLINSEHKTNYVKILQVIYSNLESKSTIEKIFLDSLADLNQKCVSLLIKDKFNLKHVQNLVKIIFQQNKDDRNIFDILFDNQIYKICKQYAEKYKNDTIMIKLYCQTQEVTGKDILNYISTKKNQDKLFMEVLVKHYMIFNKINFQKINKFKLILDFEDYHQFIYEKIKDQYPSCSWLLALKLKKPIDKQSILQFSCIMNNQTYQILTQVYQKNQKDVDLYFQQKISQACKKINEKPMLKQQFGNYLMTRQFQNLKEITKKFYLPLFYKFLLDLDITYKSQYGQFLNQLNHASNIM